MNLDLSDVPESTALAIHRLVQLSEQGHSGEVVVNLHDGGVREFREPREFDTADLKRMAARESANGAP